MKEFTDEMVRYLCDLVVDDKRVSEAGSLAFYALHEELYRREELANLDFEDDCLEGVL